MAGIQHKPHRQRKLHGQVKTPTIYLIFNWVFAALFAGIFFLILFNNTGMMMHVWWLWLLISAASGILFSLLLSRLFLLLPAPGKKVETVVVIVMFAFLVAAQAVLGWMLRVNPVQSPLYGNVYDFAQQFALHNEATAGYFSQHVGDAGFYVWLSAFFSILRMCGITEFLLPAMVLNIFAIDLALLLLYLGARYLFGARRAIFLLFLNFLTLPLLLYVPIISAETLALPFVIGMVYKWLHTRKDWRSDQKKEAIWGFLLVSGLAAVGSLFRLSVLIMWIAIFLDLLILLTGKGRVRLALGGLALVAALVVGFGAYIRYGSVISDYDYGNGVPVTKDIMSGLEEYGTYNDADEARMQQLADRAARRDYAADEIGKRLNEMGIGGVFLHLGDKLSYTFGDGTYGASLVLSDGAVQPSALQGYLTYNGAWFTITAYGAFALQAALLFWMVVAAVKAALRRNEALTFVRMAIFGVVLFLLIFQTNTRSLLPFIPLFLLCALEASPILRAPRPKEKLLPAGMAPAKDAQAIGEMAATGESAQPSTKTDTALLFAMDSEEGAGSLKAGYPSQEGMFFEDVAAVAATTKTQDLGLCGQENPESLANTTNESAIEEITLAMAVEGELAGNTPPSAPAAIQPEDIFALPLETNRYTAAEAPVFGNVGNAAVDDLFQLEAPHTAPALFGEGAIYGQELFGTEISTLFDEEVQVTQAEPMREMTQDTSAPGTDAWMQPDAGQYAKETPIQTPKEEDDKATLPGFMAGGEGVVAPLQTTDPAPLPPAADPQENSFPILGQEDDAKASGMPAGMAAEPAPLPPQTVPGRDAPIDVEVKENAKPSTDKSNDALQSLWNYF